MQNDLYGMPPAFFESRPVTPFCQMRDEAQAGVCRALGISLPRALFRALQTAFRDIEHRDPTVGELRLLAELHRLTLHDASRIAIGELDTDDAELAETWAELMERRRLLADGMAAPCTLPDILTATNDYLCRLGERQQNAPLRVFCAEAPGDLAPCGLTSTVRAAGYTPLAQVSVGGVDRLLGKYEPERYTITGRKTAPAAGDLILLVQGLPDETAAALTHRCALPRSDRVLPSITPLNGRPLPLALCDLTDGAELRVEALFPARTGDIMTEVTRFGTDMPATDMTYLLRVRRDEFESVRRICQSATPMPAMTVIGQTVGAPRLTFLHMGVVLASLSLPVLRLALAPGLYSVRLDIAPTMGELPVPAPTVSRPEPAPGIRAASVVYAPDSTHTAFHQSRAAVEAVVAALRDIPGTITLSVAVTGYRADRDAELAAPFAALCGLYRAAAELRLASPDPYFRAAQSSDEPCVVSLCGFVEGG